VDKDGRQYSGAATSDNTVRAMRARLGAAYNTRLDPAAPEIIPETVSRDATEDANGPAGPAPACPPAEPSVP